MSKKNNRSDNRVNGFSDIWVIDQLGNLQRIAVRVSPREAARFTREAAKNDPYSGSFIWPHDMPLPEKLFLRATQSGSDNTESNDTEEQYYLTVLNVSTGQQTYRRGTFNQLTAIASHLMMPGLALTITPHDFVWPERLGQYELGRNDFANRSAFQWFKFFYGGFESERPGLYESLQQRFWEQVFATAGMLDELESDEPDVDSALSALDADAQFELWKVFSRSVFDIQFHVHMAAMRNPPKPSRRYRKRATA